MSWIYGYIHKDPDHHDPARAVKTLHTHHSAHLDIYCGGRPQTCLSFKHPLQEDTTVFILGDPILRVGDDYRYPNTADWVSILADEELLRALDGHWLIVIAGADSVVAYNDPLCKRSLYVHEDACRIFITSDLAMLRSHCSPEIDLERFGAYWFSLFPPGVAGQNLLPSYHSWYRDVSMLGTGGKAVLDSQGVHITQRDWLPEGETGDLPKRLVNMVLLPFRAGKKVVLGLSGGMDIRALLAVCLATQVDFSAVHFGSGASVDYQIAHSIARQYNIPFKLITYEESGVSWEQAKNYLASRGIGFSPASCDFMGYYPILAQDNDVFVSGYFGELFRFRFFSAYRKCLGHKSPFGADEIAAITQTSPPPLFIHDVLNTMYAGYRKAVEQTAHSMRDSREMQDLLWVDLLLTRYKPRTIDMPNLAWIDGHITDHMPFLQSSVISGHWSHGITRQLFERLHRDMVRKYQPSLASFPIALASVSAPYYMPSLAMKLKLWTSQRKKGTAFQGRGTRFLQDNKEHVLELLNDSLYTSDPLLDQQRINQSVQGFYQGDLSQAPLILSLLSYLLGK